MPLRRMIDGETLGEFERLLAFFFAFSTSAISLARVSTSEAAAWPKAATCCDVLEPSNTPAAGRPWRSARALRTDAREPGVFAAAAPVPRSLEGAGAGGDDLRSVGDERASCSFRAAAARALKVLPVDGAVSKLLSEVAHTPPATHALLLPATPARGVLAFFAEYVLGIGAGLALAAV